MSTITFRLITVMVVLSLSGSMSVLLDPWPPTDVDIRWVNNDVAEMKWTQISNANLVCIDKISKEDVSTFVGCFSSDGAGLIELAIPFGINNDIAYYPQPGERYYILEFIETDENTPLITVGQYGPFPISDRPYFVYFPQVHSPDVASTASGYPVP
jgi:hypothetical protein